MKIYDCFTFFNELDLLEIRLKMLCNTVDYFVLVECAKTQQGEDKPFYFDANKKRYARWLDKIIHIKVTDVQDISHDVLEDWSIENHQRNCIFRGLVNARPDDIIIISDLDEIPNPYLLSHLDEFSIKEVPMTDWKGKIRVAIKKAIKKLLGTYQKNVKLSEAIEKQPIALEQKFFYFYMNCQNLSNNWHGSIILRFKAFMLPQILRDKRRKLDYVPVSNKNNVVSGWHFSYLGGKESVVKKLNSIIEGHRINDEITLPENMTTEEYISYCIENAKDLYQHDTYSFIPLDYIGIQNPNSYATEYPNFFKIEKFDENGIEKNEN